MNKKLVVVRECVEEELLAHVHHCRGRVLNLIEAQIGSSENWRIIRNQLLNIFGESGLAGAVQSAIDEAFGGK